MQTKLLRVANTKEVQPVKLTVEELIEELELLKWERGVKSFRITESFQENNLKEFEVENLQVEKMDQIILFGDSKDVIINNMSVLMGFLQTSLLQISKTSSQCYELLFPDRKVVVQGS